MSGSKYKEWILQTIDQLRIRKARPDMGRICHMAKRKHGLKYAETEAQLEKLVQEEAVIKVEFKGSISYRNAAKTRKIRFGKIINPSDEIRDQIYDAIKDLSTGGDESSERKGAAIQDIEKWLLTNTREKSRILKTQLQQVLDRDAENGKLKKLSNGTFVIKSKKKKKKKNFLPNRQTAPASGSSVPMSSPGKRGRPPSKRKKFRKTHGPDFAESPIFPKKTNSTNDDEIVCDFCLNNEECNSKGDKEALLICKDCNATAHPSCMGYNDGLARRALSSPWQCIDCKTCYVCEDSGEGDMMLFCDACDKGYHMLCHNPPVTEKPLGKWVCGQCVLEGSADELSIDTDDLQDSMLSDSQNMDGASCLPTPCDSPVSTDDSSRKEEVVVAKKRTEKRKRSGDSTHNILGIDVNNYPDASRWNVIDVVNFFTKIGFKEQAESFKEQEIDGQSLLLMKRMDVLTGLNIKLGPALKIYQHVMKLQTAGIDLDSLS